MRQLGLLALITMLSAVALASCDDAGIDTESIAAATVRVRAVGCGPRTELGVGTSIGDGVVVTAAHVVAGAGRVEVVDQLGQTTAADVVFFDPALDVAALRPAVAPPASVALRHDRPDEGETGVMAIPTNDGSIRLVDVEVMQRTTIRTTDIYLDDEVQRSGLRLSAVVEPGDSGAMVHLAGGGVGIVWSRSTEASDRAWTVDLPAELSHQTSRRALVDPVGTGACP